LVITPPEQVALAQQALGDDVYEVGEMVAGVEGVVVAGGW
jgi:hypothetical protein